MSQSGWNDTWHATGEPTCAYVLRAMSAIDEHRRARGLGEQLRLARPVHRDERPHRGVDRVARR